ncbi:hypothetical protein [Sphingomonas sp.]|uniref:hypothetical protein n=1 Tax=Sphingomonas sp. TaxID=28214 RepID=UPI002DD63772|nr:hypothetical protein [Sphingomonas sp.]
MNGRANLLGVALAVVAIAVIAAPSPTGAANGVITVRTCLGSTIAIPIDLPEPRSPDDRACHAPACLGRLLGRDSARRAAV